MGPSVNHSALFLAPLLHTGAAQQAVEDLDRKKTPWKITWDEIKVIVTLGEVRGGAPTCVKVKAAR
jgi:hypothetical protein